MEMQFFARAIKVSLERTFIAFRFFSDVVLRSSEEDKTVRKFYNSIDKVVRGIDKTKGPNKDYRSDDES